MRKTLIICQSIHHQNTLKVARALAHVLDADIIRPSELTATSINKYNLVGFGSGIYDDKHHMLIFDAVDKFPNQKNKKAFVFSTSGVPIKILREKFFNNYIKKCHKHLVDKLVNKGFIPVGEFSRPGFNTNVFLKYFGGLNKNRPNNLDLEKARQFAISISTK